MKKLIFTTLFMFACMVYVAAQNYQEVVYLKNGSVIRGVVIEQIPNESLKIKTNDGNIFAYKMSEVEKITKEEQPARNSYQRNNRAFVASDNFRTKSSSNSSITNYNNYRERGYKGFVDVGYVPGVGDWATDRMELTTTHGCQINPYLFVGAGLGIQYYGDADAVGVPLFANARGYLFDSKFSPFLDMKIGYTVADLSGFYFNPSIGVSYDMFDLSLGYQMQRIELRGWYDGYSYSGSVNASGISIKLGVNF